MNDARVDVIVLGGGAAGLMCAFTAASRGRRVLILEKANKIGKKILMSGGGRCNFTNYFVEAENFISNNPHFCKSALSRYTQWDFIALVEKHGIAYEERKHGQLFCLNSAKDILDMLKAECVANGVVIKTDCEVAIQGQSSLQQRYQVDITQTRKGQSERSTFYCDSLVIATGALSIPTLGGSGQGYDWGEQFGLSLTPRRAGLVPFMFSDATKALCERLSGISTEVEVRCHKQSFREAMLFTHRGLSGPAILQISNYWQPGDEIDIDLLPDTDALQWLPDVRQRQPRSLLRSILSEKLPRALVLELQTLWWSELAESPLSQFSEKRLADIAGQLNHWRLKPSATEGYRTAEVTLGGIDTEGVSSRTMEAKRQPGLYFVGEVLDVSGHLGGFNFQWAWASGHAAGLYC